MIDYSIGILVHNIGIVIILGYLVAVFGAILLILLTEHIRSKK